MNLFNRLSLPARACTTGAALFGSLVVLFSAAGCDQGREVLLKEPVGIKEADVVYKAAPRLPKGITMAVLEGNPENSGIYTLRIRAEALVSIPVHYHLTHERVTVLTGQICTGFGTRFTEKALKCYNGGDFYINPSRRLHFLKTGPEGVTLQVTGLGPWQVIKPVNPQFEFIPGRTAGK